MLTLAFATPVTTGWVAGVVAPAGIKRSELRSPSKYRYWLG